MALDGRKAPILKIVVERFIQTGEPVGSKYVAQAMGNSVSSATIRNEMVPALEEAGPARAAPHLFGAGFRPTWAIGSISMK